MSSFINPRKYWSVLKTRLKKEGIELVTNCNQLKMVSADGTISREIMSDFCHPTDKGYQIWADQLRDLLALPQ